MRQTMTVVVVVAIVAVAASAAMAGGQQFQLEDFMNLPYNGGNPVLWNDPHASTGGALWIDTGGGPNLVAQDITSNCAFNAPAPYGWTTFEDAAVDHTAGPGGQRGQQLGWRCARRCHNFPA